LSKYGGFAGSDGAFCSPTRLVDTKCIARRSNDFTKKQPKFAPFRIYR
jgi:hypothetical protein